MISRAVWRRGWDVLGPCGTSASPAHAVSPNQSRSAREGFSPQHSQYYITSGDAMAERVGFEPTVRGKANSRFRVGPVMTTSVPLRAHIRFSVGTSVLLPLRGRGWDVLSRFALNTMRCRASLPPPLPLTRGRRTHGPR